VTGRRAFFDMARFSPAQMVASLTVARSFRTKRFGDWIRPFKVIHVYRGLE
jgi:hypothetical protein